MRFVSLFLVAWLTAAGMSAAQAVLNEDGTFSFVPAAEILKAEIDASTRLPQEAVAFYEARAYVPLWSGKYERQKALLEVLSSSGEHGLPQEVYRIEQLERLQADAASLEGRARLEVAFSEVFLTYMRHSFSGVLTPREINSEIQHDPTVLSPRDILQGYAQANSPRLYLEGMLPDDDEYRALIAEKRRLKGLLATEARSAQISARGMMRPGYLGQRVVQVRDRLRVLGYPALGTDPTYDEALAEVVRTFQTDHKLRPDAVMGPATIGALNKSSSDRLAQVLVNLERRRWLNHDKSGRHINVNIADFTMEVSDNGVRSFASDVVVGKTGRDYRTPEFSKDMTHLIFNPYWHVPRSIAGREYLPLLKQDPLALSRRGLLLLNRRGQVLNTAGADFSGYSARNFPFFIKQPPGKSNALGRVKFMFPNRNNIYLHDTPAKKLFRRDRRAYSHGCIRVARPLELAEHLLTPQYTNPMGNIDALLRKKRERQVHLDTSVPVHLYYHTAFMADDGTIAYREDVYKRDDAIFRALLNAGVSVEGLSG